MILLTFLAAADMARASDDEVRERKAIFILENFQQWVNVKYQFEDQYSNNGTQGSYSHEFQEYYNASLGADIIGPHFFSTNLSFSIGPDQNLNYTNGQKSTYGNDLKYTYQFSGSGLDKSASPFTINSYRDTTTVNSAYSPSYTSSYSGNEFSVSLLNTLLPSTFRYVRTTLDNTGGGNTSSTVSNSFNYSATHQYKDLSSTMLFLSLSDSNGTFSGGSEQSSSSYSASLTNTLQWGAGKKYSLNSLASVLDTSDQSAPQRNVNLSESYQAALGKALTLQMSYTLADTSSLGFSSQQQNTRLNQGEMILTHRLFDSLKTSLHGKISSDELLGGTESRYSGEADLLYTKKLPGEDRLILAVAGVREVIDNRLASSLLTITNENHPGVHQGDIVTLLQSGVLNSVTGVRSINPLFTYSEGVDYTVNLALGQITILQGGRIDTTGAGMSLQISYTVFIDSNLKYANDTLNLNANITFGAGRYSAGGSLSEQWMSLISGPSQNSLRDSSIKQLYFTGVVSPYNYRISYTNSMVGQLAAQAFEASGQFIRNFSMLALSVLASERYSLYGATSTVAAYAENTTTGSVGIVRNISSNMRMTLSANVLDDRSGQRSPRDIASLTGSLHYWLNKITIGLDGKTAWTFSGGTTSRDDTVNMNISRYF